MKKLLVLLTIFLVSCGGSNMYIPKNYRIIDIDKVESVWGNYEVVLDTQDGKVGFLDIEANDFYLETYKVGEILSVSCHSNDEYTNVCKWEK